MRISQSYYIAQVARNKLLPEASRADHNLRVVVGHANLLDSLLIQLEEAAQEHENRLGQPAHRAAKPSQRRRVKGANIIVEDAEEGWLAEVDSSDSLDSDNDYSSDEENDTTGISPSHRIVARRAVVASCREVREFEDDNVGGGDSDHDGHVLHLRQPQGISAPELKHDSDDDSDDDSDSEAPSSFSEKQRQQTVTTVFQPTLSSSLSISPAKQKKAATSTASSCRAARV
jgi:hypothetical protein